MWYGETVILPEPEPANHWELKRRKAIVEKRLENYGIKNTQITFLSYLDFSEDEFQPIEEVGKRILILWSVAFLAQDLQERGEIEAWLKNSMIWDSVSPYEKTLFTDDVDQKDLIKFSWMFEAFIVLCWAVNLLEELPDLECELSVEETDNLMAKLPINEDATAFFAGLKYRNKEDVFIENIVNEMITSYLRDGMLSWKREKLNLNVSISFERHKALNWLRQFSGISEWEETDTST